MTIAERPEPGKAISRPSIQVLWQRLPKDILLLATLVLASLLSFGLGVLAGREDGEGKGQVLIEKIAEAEPEPSVVPPPNVEGPPRPATKNPVAGSTSGELVASKTGTKYYLPWCGTAKRIKEENKVWFKSKAEAEAAGYTPAKNCKGL